MLEIDGLGRLENRVTPTLRRTPDAGRRRVRWWAAAPPATATGKSYGVSSFWRAVILTVEHAYPVGY